MVRQLKLCMVRGSLPYVKRQHEFMCVCVYALQCGSCYKQLPTLIDGPQSGTASEHCDTPQALLAVVVYGAVILLNQRLQLE